MIIYPPFIGDTIPAFSNETVKIPFQQNPAVDIDDVKSFWLVVKKYNEIQPYKRHSVNKDDLSLVYNNETKSGIVTFDISDDAYINTQYYKFQLGYSDEYVNPNDEDENDDTNVVYSSVAVGRYLDLIKSIISIDGLDEGATQLNPYRTEYIGNFRRPCASEPLYAYNFSLYSCDLDDNCFLLETTGDILWNVDHDEGDTTTKMSKPTFKPVTDLAYGQKYKIVFKIQTVNNYTQEVEYFIIKQNDYASFFEGKIEAVQNNQEDDYNYENGCISIKFSGTAVNGHFLLERTSGNNIWEELLRFDMAAGDNLSNFVYRDYSVEHGVTYTYALRQYAGTCYSQRIVSNPIASDFAAIFLSDENKQLKIAFDPKISSFKNTILEQKTDAIGSAYPFFYRNGSVKYKEIPLSGLISYWMDEAHTFMSTNDLGLTKDKDGLNIRQMYPTMDLTGENIAAERRFKTAVLEWLNDGNPKLLRTPTEGSYIVRLMNISLSPNDTIGRMLHTFNSTAYEIMECTLANIQNNNLKYDNSLNKNYSSTIRTASSGTYQNIRNLTWKTTFPNCMAESEKSLLEWIVLDGQRISNSRGEYNTLKGQMYSYLNLDHLRPGQSQCTFELVNKHNYNQATDKFQSLANKIMDNKVEQRWITISYTGSLPSNIIYIHNMYVEDDINYSGSTPSSITINGNTFSIVDDSVREFRDIHVTSLAKAGGATITALVSREVS